MVPKTLALGVAVVLGCVMQSEYVCSTEQVAKVVKRPECVESAGGEASYCKRSIIVLENRNEASFEVYIKAEIDGKLEEIGERLQQLEEQVKRNKKVMEEVRHDILAEINKLPASPVTDEEAYQALRARLVKDVKNAFEVPRR